MRDEQQVRAGEPGPYPGVISGAVALATQALAAQNAALSIEVAMLRAALANGTRELVVWHEQNPCPPAMQLVCVSCGSIEDGQQLLAAPSTAGEYGAAIVAAADALNDTLNFAVCEWLATPEMTAHEWVDKHMGSLVAVGDKDGCYGHLRSQMRGR